MISFLKILIEYRLKIAVAQRPTNGLYCCKNETMKNLNLLKTFIEVAEQGSFTKAAKRLNQPKSRVSRHIANLERDLGVELIRRTTRQTSLTMAGQDFFSKILRPMRELESQLNIISDHRAEINGKIRLTAPEDMAQTLVKDILFKFEEEFPRIQFEVLVSNDFLDLIKENIDFAFRAGKMADSSLMQRKLLDTSIVMVASKEYLHAYGKLSKIEDLQNHKLLAFSSISFDNFSSKEMRLQPSIKCDSFPVLLSMALKHKGIAILPEFFCRKHIEKGRLVKILPESGLKSAPIHLVYPASKNMPKRNQLFIERTLEFIKNNRGK